MAQPKDVAKRLGQENYPITAAELRERVLDVAGFDPEAVGAWMKKSADKLVEKLDAKTTKFFTSEGRVTDSREVGDNASQIKAASELLSLGVDIMALKKQEGSGGSTPRAISIDLSGWSVQAPPKDVTPVPPQD